MGNDYDTPDGTAIRDYVHVMDVAEGHVVAINKLLEGKTTGNHIYNLGKGKGKHRREQIVPENQVLEILSKVVTVQKRVNFRSQLALDKNFLGVEWR